MFALHKAFEQSTRSVEDAARAERERRSQLAQSRSAHGRLDPSSSTSPRAGATTALGHPSRTASSPLPTSPTVQRSSSYQSQPIPQSRSPPLTPVEHAPISKRTNALKPPGRPPPGELPSTPSQSPSRSTIGSQQALHSEVPEQVESSFFVTSVSNSRGQAVDHPLPAHPTASLFYQKRGASASDAVRGNKFAIRSSREPSPIEGGDSSTSRRVHDHTTPFLSVSQRSNSPTPGSSSQVLMTLRSSTEAESSRPRSARSPSPAEAKTSSSSSSAVRLLGRLKRDKSPAGTGRNSASDSGARSASPELLTAYDGHRAKGRTSQESRGGRKSTSSESPSVQAIANPTAANASQRGGSRRPSTSLGVQEAGRRSPALTAGTASLEVPKSSTDSSPSSRRFSFGFLASAIHSGRSNKSDSTDSAVLSQAPASSALAQQDQNEPRLSGVSSRSTAFHGSGERGGDSSDRAQERPTTTGGTPATDLGLTGRNGNAKTVPPSRQSKFSLFSKTGAVSSAPQDRVTTSVGNLNLNSVSYFDASNEHNQVAITTSPTEHLKTPDRPQLATRSSASNVLRSFRSRSSNNLRLFGRTPSTQSDTVPPQVEGASVSILGKNERSNAGGSRLGVPSMVQAFAIPPPAETASHQFPFSPATVQTPSKMARAFSKRRPATGPDAGSAARDGRSGEAGDLSPAMSRASLAVDDRVSLSSRDGRLRSTSGASSVAGRPMTPGSQLADTSKLGASGGAAGLFGSGSDTRSKTIGKSGKGIFSSGGNSGPNWLTPRKKNMSDLDLANVASSTSDRKPSENGYLTAPRAHSGDTVEGQQSPRISPAAAVDKKPVKFPPRSGESPQAFCDRIEQNVSPGDVVSLLANSGDPYFVEALRCHMRRFLFVGNPLDIALRKLLMEVCLPKETQQIDRVMEAFAHRYNECNEGLFASEDQPYILAFSLMMLHTDAFNKNAKNKMTKADYVRNSSSSGVAQDVLEYLYDNLTFTEFVYFDGLEKASNEAQNGIASAPSATLGYLSKGATGASSYKDKSGKIDVYLLIKQGRLSEYQPWIEHLIPEDDPFNWMGTENKLDIAALAEAYLAAPSIEISTQRRPSLISSPPSAAANLEFASGIVDGPSVTLRVFKVGIIHRKDDVTDKGKRTSRKWRPCGVILSSSQLLFFRDLVWIDALKAQIADQVAAADPEERRMGIIIAPRIRELKPDDVLSLNDALAVRDDTYDKHDNVLRLVNQHGNSQFEYLFQAKNEDEMNDWCAAINFCACFRAAGLKVTNINSAALAGGQDDGDRNGGDVFNPLAPTVSPRDKSSPDNQVAQATNLQEGLLPQASANRQEMITRLQTFTKTLNAHSSELAELLRVAKHFAIMTPFQRATKERIEAAAVPLAARIRQLRIAVAKYESRTFILASEVRAAEDEEKKLAAKRNNSGFGDWNFARDSSSRSSGPVSPPSSTRNASGTLSGSFGSGLASLSRSAQGDRKNSWLSHTGVSDSLSSSVSPLQHTSMEVPAVHEGLPRPARQLSSSEMCMEAEGSPRKSIGSFAPAAYQPGYASSNASTPSRSRLGAMRRKSSTASAKLPHRQSSEARGDIAESWEATKAFRDPDRISIARLPDLSTLEAAARKKSLQRAALESTVPLAVDDLDAIIALPSARSVGKNRKASEGSVAEVEKLTRSSSISSGSGSIAIQQSKAIDPPPFMTTWGM